MKKNLIFRLFVLCLVLVGCTQEDEFQGSIEQKMKSVSISAEMGGTDARASIDSETGAFAWQSGDVISVLATDGKFYDFVLEGESGTKTAEFVGQIPETAEITTVATYPRIVANGSDNTILDGSTLNYNLPATWTYAKDVSNVPMVATFAEGATHMAFKQVGAVMRFPVKKLPKQAKFIVTMKNKTITGQFPVDITALGESCMTAGTNTSELVINYTSDVYGGAAEFNVPIPTGTYNDFTVTIKDVNNVVLFTKEYSEERVVERATLLNMKEVALDLFIDDGVGTEPDDTNYDVYGLGELPIDYWQDVHPKWHNWEHDKMLVEYQAVKDAGMNIIHFFGDGRSKTLEENLKVLKVAEELGMKYIGWYEADGWDSDTRIQNIKNHLAKSPAYIGDHVWGEPEDNVLDQFKEFADRYVAAMPEEEPWSVLYPSYYKLRDGVLHFDEYISYVDKFLDKIPARMLTYDYYGLGPVGGYIASDFYTNLDFVRERTLKRRMPFGVITQSGRVNQNREPSEVDQRWTVWANLALGAKYISYFCYCNPTDDYSGPTFGEYMVELNTNEKTDKYYIVQRVNRDIKTIGKKLLYCHADGAISSTTKYYPLFDYAGNGRTKYGPIQKVTAISENVICGCFRDARRSENGDNYKGYKALVVAHQPNRIIKTNLTLDFSVTTITVTQNNTSKVIELNNLTDVTFDGEKGIHLSYSDGKLTLDIPSGEAALIEF